MTDWFVAPDVAAGGDGSIGSPWALRDALHAGPGNPIAPGDRVFLRGGIYASMQRYEVTVAGAQGAPVTFLPYDDESPLLDGSLTEFWQSSEPQWEPFGTQRDGHHVYRSIAQLPPASGYKGLIDVDGLRLTLVPYLDRAYFESDVHTWSAPDPWYVGPGLWWDAATRRLHVRLDNSTPEAQANRDGVAQLAVPDPNRYAIRVTPAGALAFRIAGSFLTFERLHFRAHEICWFVTGAPTGLRFLDCTCEPHTRVARLAGARDVKILGGTFVGHTPSEKWWASVGDIHGGPARGAEKAAFDFGGGGDVELGPSADSGRRMVVRQFFDGILGVGPLRDVTVHGVWFDEIWDDAWQMKKNVDDVNYFDNVHFGAGPSRWGIPSIWKPEGRVWIHDNVIDTTIHALFWWRGGRGGAPPEGESIAFSSHTQPAADELAWPWKLYFNTVVTGKRAERHRYVGCGRFGLNISPQKAHEVFNNIFVVLDGKAFARDFHTKSPTEVYDGNCLWSDGAWVTHGRGPYQRVYTSAQPAGYAINSLAKFKEDTYADSSAHYPPGWEQSGVEADPQLIGFYEPDAPEARTGAVDISAKNWPDAAPYREQRGAKLTTPMPLQPGEVVVPYVIGERHANAHALITAAELRSVDATPPPPLVKTQDPAPGHIVAAGTEVLLNT